MAILALSVAACIFIIYLVWYPNDQRIQHSNGRSGKGEPEKTASTAPQLVLSEDAGGEKQAMSEKRDSGLEDLTRQTTGPKAIGDETAAMKLTEEKEAIAAPKKATDSGSSMQKEQSDKKLDQKLMPPPAKPVPPKPRAPAASQGLRVPSSGPLPNRLPPAKSSLSGGSSLSTPSVSTLPPNKRSTKKVQLKPGHSPLDWADKTRSENLSGVPCLQKITPSQLKTQTGRKGKPAWSSYKGRVYNIGPYLAFHPGGEDQLMRAAGRDGAKLFEEIHPWVNWDHMMESCLVGFLVPEEVSSDDLDGLD